MTQQTQEIVVWVMNDPKKTNECSKNFILKNFWLVTLTAPCKGWCISMPNDSQMITKRCCSFDVKFTCIVYQLFDERKDIYIKYIFCICNVLKMGVYKYIYIIIYIICISVFSKE